MSGRVPAGQDGLHKEHDNTGFNKASGQNQSGALSSSQGVQTIFRFLCLYITSQWKINQKCRQTYKVSVCLHFHMSGW